MSAGFAGKFFKILFRIIAILLVAFALAGAMLLIFQGIFSPFQIVMSDSMSPQIKTGDAIVMKDLEPKAIKTGDVIIFQDPQNDDQFIVHRVVGIEDTGYVRYFTTKGDNNPVIDEQRIPTGEVVGGVAVRLPRFGRFITYLQSRRGYTLCIVIPAAASLFIVLVLGVIEKIMKGRARRQALYEPQPTGALER